MTYTKKALEHKYIAFCEEYLANGYNAVNAYLFAFDANSKNAQTNAYRIFNKPFVIDYIAKREQEIFAAQRITAEHIASELSSIAFEKDRSKVSYAEKMKALELLQKQFGLQQQSIKAEVDKKVVIDINIKEDEE